MPPRGPWFVALVAIGTLLLAPPRGTAQDAPPPAPPAASGEPEPAVEAPAQTVTPTPRPNPPQDAPAASPPFMGWEDGFRLRSADKRFDLRITGQLQADYRWYADPADTTDIDGFLLRRARFGLEATLFKYYDFRFLPDFGSGQTRLTDGYMNVRYWESFQFIAGKFKQPFSYEQLIQDRFTPLMERSLIDQLVPQRDLGAMVQGQNLFAGRLDYGVAVSNGVQNGDADTDNSKDLNARVAVRPFAVWEESPLRRLQLGMSGGFGVLYSPVNPSGLRSPDGVPFFQFLNGVLADGGRSRWSPEVAYFLEGLGMSAQYFHMTQRLRAANGSPVHVPFDGFYVQGTYLLTGEERTGYSQQIAPLRPFDPAANGTGLGAIELVGRVSRLVAGDRVFAGGPNRLADPAAVSNGATEMTLGVNWYLNRWARVQFNWEHVWFDRPVRLGGPGAGGLLPGQDTLLTRVQFVF
jgi:phosphate-selective porin OprO/OprP